MNKVVGTTIISPLVKVLLVHGDHRVGVIDMNVGHLMILVPVLTILMGCLVHGLVSHIVNMVIIQVL
jgi:hypothetical protein